MTLEAAMNFKPPDHDLENRSASGVSAGARRRIRFGTGSGRETEHAHLADFYKIVDRGIHKLLHESMTPLLLAGVAENIAAYRTINAYGRLAEESLYGSSTVTLQAAETVMYARSLLGVEECRRQAKVLMEEMERVPPDRFLTDPHGIVSAAFEGRVRQLYVNESVEITAVFERPGYPKWGREDLLNLAAVKTMLYGGRAVELPGEMIPGWVGAVAILRYGSALHEL
jgi:hypothetical protein